MIRPNILHSSVIQIPQHEVLLSFVSDGDAEWFEEWLNEVGFKQFQQWLEETKNE